MDVCIYTVEVKEEELSTASYSYMVVDGYRLKLCSHLHGGIGSPLGGTYISIVSITL